MGVIIGRGMKCYNHAGNKMIRQIVASRLADYAFTTCRKEKSYILSSVMEKVRLNEGAFIQKDTAMGLWFDADEGLARDKVSQIFRNALYYNEKRSQKEKMVKMQNKKKQKKKFFPLQTLKKKKKK